MKPTAANDIVVIDETEPCPYLKGQVARMPLRMPLARITGRDADTRLALGHRRTGEFIYETQCPACNACEPMRIDVQTFEFSRNQKRVLKRGDRLLTVRRSRLVTDAEHLQLFNRHRLERGLAKSESAIDLDEYEWGFVRSCFDSFEFSYWQDDRLAGVAICDTGSEAISAVYTFYDPTLAKLSLGTYSLLNQIRFCQSTEVRYLYLGYYIAQCTHMNYKARFKPHQRLLCGEWVTFEAP